jgi:hypothetical protein
MAYPKTIHFNDSDNRVIVNALPGGRFSAIDPDQPQEGQSLIWGIGDTELAAIADLERQLREAE